MDDGIGERIERLGKDFRGLWVSTYIEGGKKNRGWACTFTHGGEYIEIEHRATPAEALDLAIETLRELRKGGRHGEGYEG